MTVASLPFLAFALAAALLFNLFRAPWWRRTVLLAVNLGFLASFSLNPVLWIPMACFLAGGYLALRFLQKPAGADALSFIPLIAAAVFAFVWLKQYSFLPAAIFLKMPYLTIGLSYMFFRLAHLLIDAHGRDLPPKISPLDYFNYIANFAALVSGPIQLYQDFAADADRVETLSLSSIGAAVERVVVGFFKVAVVSMLLLQLHESGRDAFAAAQGFADRIVDAGVLGSAYVFYLYYNFAGYMDIVIGIGRLFGMNLPENFNRPFAANNFLDFWARWHMTLSNWLRVYVYNPLLKWLLGRFPQPGVAPYLGVIAIFFTFFLIGLWHGQTAIFAIYGVLLGFGVSANLLYQQQMAKRFGRRRYREIAAAFPYQMAARGITFAWFTLSLVCFWGRWDQVAAMCDRLGMSGIAAAFCLTAVVSAVAFALLEKTIAAAVRVQAASGSVLHSRYARTVYSTALAWFVMAALALAQSTPTIVYEKF